MRTVRILLIAVLLVSLAPPSLPPATMASDDAGAPFLFTPDERAKLCARFTVGGATFQARDSWHGNEMICDAYEDPQALEGFRGKVILHLYGSTEAAIGNWHGEEGFAEYKQQDADGPVYAYEDRLRYLNSHIVISLSGWPKSDPEVVRRLERMARSIVDEKAAPARKYKVSIAYTTTPFEATVKVVDEQGKPTPGKQVQILLYIDQVSEHYAAYWSRSLLATYDYSPDRWLGGFELIDLLPRTDLTTHSKGEIDAHRRWKTAADGTITVPLHSFNAVKEAGSLLDSSFGLGLPSGYPRPRQAAAPDGYDLRGYVFHSDWLSPKMKQLPPARLTIVANLVEGTGDDEEVVATAQTVAELDHVAKLVAIRKELRSPATVTIRRGTRRVDVSSADLQPGGAYPDGYELIPGDVIIQAEQVEISLEWFFGRKSRITVRKSKVWTDSAGEREIAIKARGTSVGTYVEVLDKAGKALGGAGVLLVIFPPTTVKGLIAAVAGFGLSWGSEAIFGVDLVVHSVVLVDLADEIDVYTVEGRVEARDWGSDSVVEVAAGQTVTLYPDTSFGPVTEFGLNDLDDEQLGLLRSAKPELVTEASFGRQSRPDGTPDPTPEPVEPTPAAVEATPMPEPPAPARDLWLHEGDTVTRVDHITGEIVERWDVSHPKCPSGHAGQLHVDQDAEAAWTTIVDAQWEEPVLECVIRLPLAGSAPLEAYPIPSGRKPTFVKAAATHDGELWAVTWKKTSTKPLAYYDDWSLTRLDRWTGKLTKALPRVVALAQTEAGLVVLHSEPGAKKSDRRPLRLGIVEPGGRTPREIPLEAALPRTKPGTYVTPRLRLSAGHEGSVALYDEDAGRDVIVFDPNSGAVIGRIELPTAASAVGQVWPVSDGVWMSGSLETGRDFVRYVPFDGWTSLDLDPCADVGGDCYAQVEAASDAGAWISAWPYDAAFELILADVIFRRYDSSGQPLAEVAGDELFGPE